MGKTRGEPAGAPALNSGGFAAAVQVLATINSNSKKVVTYFNGALLPALALPCTCIEAVGQLLQGRALCFALLALPRNVLSWL